MVSWTNQNELCSLAGLFNRRGTEGMRCTIAWSIKQMEAFGIDENMAAGCVFKVILNLLRVNQKWCVFQQSRPVCLIKLCISSLANGCTTVGSQATLKTVTISGRYCVSQAD